MWLKAYELYPNTSDLIGKFDGKNPTDEECDAYDAHWNLPIGGWNYTNEYDETAELICHINEFLIDILGYSKTYSECHNYVRVFDGIKIYYHEHQIEELSSKFM